MEGENNKKISTKNKLKLNNGMEIPSIGYGTYQIRKKSEIENSIKIAYDNGYRLFDTAVMYGNENLIGNALTKHKIPREEIFITTKILPSDMTYEKSKRSIEESLKKLKLKYIDMVLIHWPEVKKKEDRINVWKAMEESVNEGKVKCIGVSNFLEGHLNHILSNCKIKPVINQIECNPLYYDKETIDFCKSQNILIEAYCPLAEFDSKLIKNKIIVDLSKKYNKTVPQIILKWIMQKGIIPLPKSVHKEYIIQNINLDDFEINDDDMKLIDGLECGYKIDWDPHRVD
jgi:diketogulonate reductase-like aldo/keto reductase